MPVTFSIITTVYAPFELLPRLLACVLQQEHSDWELLLVVDGDSPRGRFSPRGLVHQMHRRAPQRVELLELPRAPGCWGNVGRHTGLAHARGDYVCWVNHDNLIAPRYLAAHAENIARRPGCLSVVDIDLWQGDRFCGRFPRRFARNQLDLLCFAAPLATARQVEAFGPAMQRVYAADWLVFDACRRLVPIEYQPVLVGTHF